MARGRRGRAVPPSLPPWWDGQSHPTAPQRSNGHRNAQVPAQAVTAATAPVAPRDRAPADPETLYTHHEEPAPDAGFVPPHEPPAEVDGAHEDVWSDDATGISEQARHPLPEGRWIDDAAAGHDLWIPETVVANGSAGAASSTESATALATPRSRQQTNGVHLPTDTPLPASRPADHESRRVRTTVDRPVASLRPIDIDEARQLAECFAIDYMSCDEDDPQLRQLALAPYLARRGDAVLGWPAEYEGEGRQRAVLARAGECLAQGRWVTVDVSVLVEVYERTGPKPSEAFRERPELPPDARWSAVPSAHAPGWSCSMTIWHRLGIPVRRHDRGHLVVELFTVSAPEE